MYTVSTDPADCWPTRQPGEAAAVLVKPTRPVNSRLFERCAVVITVSTELILLVTSGHVKKKEGKKSQFSPLLNMPLITLPMTIV